MTAPTPADSHQEFADIPTQPETRGIELVSESERHGKPRDLFSVWAATMVSVLNFTIGASFTAVLGLEIWQSIAVVLVASLLWVFPGIVAVSGPAAGTSGSVIQRAIYGFRGNKIVIAFYGWFISGVFLALNWVASSFMGAELLTRMGIEDKTIGLVVVTVVVSIVTVLVAVYGHALILKAFTALTILLLLIFLVVTGFILPTVDWNFTQPEPLQGVALWSSLTIAFAILASSPLSFSNSADMARYLPRDAKPSHIIWATALGGAVPFTFFTIVGALLGSVVSADALEFGIEFAMLDMLPVWLGPIFVIGVIVNTVALNGMTTYTASMAFQSIGVPIRRIPSAILIGVLGTAFTLFLVMSTSLIDAINLMLQFLLIISVPTIAVYVADIVLRRNRYNGLDLFDERPGAKFWYHGGFSLAGLVSVVAGGTATALFLSTDVWTGPFAVSLGYIDLSTPVGIVVSIVVYTVLAKRRIRAQIAE
ncbi:purine-cytosine permease family protein [Leucobacter tenebrionis]|uniref:purine-cytosine permease family protein n=1 Tax=Leucobacter tenebrionis TaxID=2873270 RepID=UPI001CA79517|nr:cytosine permease [Leucobacter tenebrionis]QZY52635.1 cytosine permease [Leucobacter tenebrionis]